MRRAEGLAARRAERLARHERSVDRASRGLAWIRLALGAALVAAGAVAWRLPEGRGVAGIAAAALAAGFVAAVALHGRVERRRRLAAEVAASARRDLLRAEGRWRELDRTGDGLAASGREQDLSADLSVLGAGSLFQLVSRCATPWGERRLAGLLLAAEAAPDLPLRQDAAREALRRPAFRRRLEAEGRLASGLHETEALAAELARPSWTDGRPWVAGVGALLATVTIAQVVQLLWSDAAPLLLPTLAVNVAWTAWMSRRLVPEYDALLDREAPVLACAGMLELVQRRGGRSELARRWRAAACTPEPASEALARLGRILASLSLRRNAFWWPVQAFVLWDSWQAPRLARWRREHGARVAAWLATLGDAEAVSSLAAHAELSGGVFADVRADGIGLRATSLSHPLLPPGKAVANDVELAGGSRILLLTGSNMSGKSTLLRAVGLDVLLALAGGPSHAASLELRRCRVLTSIRISDALDEGVSLFYAEVRRLKAVVEASEEAAAGRAEPVLFLVDEILRGTNTRERHAAARAIVARLARTGSAGIVTSHDVELTDLEGRVEGVANGHFREEIRDGRMGFDYRLRPGPVTTSNALAILRLEGIDVPPP